MKNIEKIKKIIYFLISIKNQKELEILNIQNNKRYQDFYEKCIKRIREIDNEVYRYLNLGTEKIFKLINKKNLEEIIDLFNKIREECKDYKKEQLIDKIEKSIIMKLDFNVIWNYICLSERNLEWFFKFNKKYNYYFYGKIKIKHINRILPILKNIKIYEIPIEISKKIVEFYPKEMMIKINEAYQNAFKEMELNYNYDIDQYYREIKSLEDMDDYVKKITSVEKESESIYIKYFINIILEPIVILFIIFILIFEILFNFKLYYRMIVKDSIVFENKKENEKINIWLSNINIIDKIEDIDFILKIVDENYFKKNKYKIKENELKILKMNKII